MILTALTNVCDQPLPAMSRKLHFITPGDPPLPTSILGNHKLLLDYPLVYITITELSIFHYWGLLQLSKGVVTTVKNETRMKVSEVIPK